MEDERETTLAFIEMWRSYPELWDIKNPQYGNKVFALRGLNALTLLLQRKNPDASVAVAKKKMQLLRKSFNREARLHKQSKRSGAGTLEVRTPRLWYFESLKFLSDSSAATTSVSSHPISNNSAVGTTTCTQENPSSNTNTLSESSSAHRQRKSNNVSLD